MPRFSLLHKVITAFLAILIPILVTMVVVFQKNRGELKDLLSAQLSHVADEREAYILMYLEMNKSRILDFSSDDFIVRTLEKKDRDVERTGKELSEYMSRYKLPLLKTMYRLNIITAKNGRVLASTLPGFTGKDLSREEFFMKGLKGLSVLEVVSNGSPEIAVSAPIFSRNDAGRVLGVITGFTRISKFGEFFTGEYIKSLGAQSWNLPGAKWNTFEIYLVNRDKLMLTPSRFIKDSVLRQRVDTPPVRACLEEGKETKGIYLDYRAERVAGASMCFPSFGWTLLAEVDEKEVFEPVIRNQRYSIAMVILIAGLTGALLLYFVRLIIMQVRNLSHVAGELAAGNYGIDIPVKTRDEIGVLAVSFKEMAFKIRQRTSELEKSQLNLKKAQQIAHIGSWEADLKSGHVYKSDEVFRIFGRSKEDLSGLEQYMSALHPQDRQRVKQTVQSALQTGRPFSIDMRIIRGDGSERTVSLQGEVERNGAANIARIWGTVQDITERKMAEEEIRRLNIDLERRVDERTAELKKTADDLAEANKEIETFTYTVAHDLRSPLRLIDGFSQILIRKKKDRLDREGRDYLDRIRSSVQHMGQLIDDLLNLYNVMRAETVFVPVDLSYLVRSIITGLKKANPERSIEISIQEGLKARGDEKLITMMLENLLVNAWKYTSKTEATRISFGSSGSENGLKVFYVKDNGVGFDMKYASRIFEPFQRLHSADEFPGTGVGLATVRGIIERHGGRVWAESEPGIGSTFFFTLEGVS